jgi:aromatic ring-opening dioxygenase LigB subunit
LPEREIVTPDLSGQAAWRGPVSIGVIAPHGDEAIAEACDEATRMLALSTQRAMEEMARRVARAGPDVVLVATPHNVHVSGHMAVITASRVAGRLDEAPVPVTLDRAIDLDLAGAVIERMEAGGVPTVGVSFGGNVVAEAVAPLDWGALIPLWHVARHCSELPVVVVAPARDMDGPAHVRAGQAIAAAARDARKTLAFVASADQGHGHSADGPYGFHPESAAFDGRIADAVRRNALGELADMSADEAHAAFADSWWQMLMLHGALTEDGGRFDARLLAYEAPTYFGMLTAVFERAD